ncbi:hypothetical protein EZJ19_14715 [Parasulfuritortus cantonensis]|uniref:Uncharacterized protein n=1 Tax=Parasulfuritortus cantonensis TaxID=2528202 RepID=A0A4R1B103_9PROT|nr:hypothetical protein [Parasulfuritortus cantonensis]TCJ11664.1 hypothetical protein EZJ19_14715 [Parasulfuritortus cantonensis]
MRACTPDDTVLQRFIVELEASPPKPHHSGLLAFAESLSPECAFRFALTQGSWYRPGGLIRTDGTRVTDDLERWADEELDACDGDLAELIDRHAAEDLVATRHAGRTHYFVAPYGPGPADFMQLEVEELQEVLDRRLIDPEHPPTDLDELTDPIEPVAVDAHAVHRPYYRFRRLTDMRRVLAGPALPGLGPTPLARFLIEWEQSRAAEKGHFCDHWILAVREHQDRYHNRLTSAVPVSRHARKLKSFHWHPDRRGVELGDQIHAFDRAGYPSAWYFHLVAGALTPTAVAYAAVEDIDSGYGYLAEKDAGLLRGWVMAPYTV